MLNHTDPQKKRVSCNVLSEKYVYMLPLMKYLLGYLIGRTGAFSDSSTAVTGPLALIITTIAVSWNFIYNCLFEFWESRQKSRIRTFRRRLAHAVGFQLTLVYLIPLIAWWLGVSLWQHW